MTSARAPRALAWLSLWLAVHAHGCKPDPPDVAQECSKGNQAACAQACRDGVHGESGCLAAAQVKNPVRRTEMFTIACQAGDGAACVEAAKASITLSMSSPRHYRQLLERACAQEQAEGCELLGDFQLLDSMELAGKYYTAGCKGAEVPERCAATVQRRMQELTKTQRACDAGDLTACQRQLGLLAPRNHDAAYLVANTLCERRGVSQHYAKSRMPFAFKLRKRKAQYHPCGLFLVARAARDPNRRFEFQRVDPPAGATPDRGGRVELESLNLHLSSDATSQPEALVAVKDTLREQLEPRLTLARRCYNRHLGNHSEASGEISAVFIVDKLGSVLDLRESSQLQDTTLRRCVVSAVVPETLEGPITDLGSTPRLEVVLKLSKSSTPANDLRRN